MKTFWLMVRIIVYGIYCNIWTIGSSTILESILAVYTLWKIEKYTKAPLAKSATFFWH